MQLSSPRGLESCSPGRQNPNGYHQNPRVIEFLPIWHFSVCFLMVFCYYQVPGGLTMATRWQLSSPRRLVSAQFAYRNAVANSICLSKRGCELNLLIETWLRTQFAYRNTVWGFGGWVLSERERGERGARDKRGERGEESEESNRVSISTLSSQPRSDKHIEFATVFR